MANTLHFLTFCQEGFGEEGRHFLSLWKMKSTGDVRQPVIFGGGPKMCLESEKSVITRCGAGIDWQFECALPAGLKRARVLGLSRKQFWHGWANERVQPQIW
jgi:hypothetical protein